jgi:hypothetical protein
LLSAAALYIHLGTVGILVQHLKRPGHVYKVLPLRLLGGEGRVTSIPKDVLSRSHDYA